MNTSSNLPPADGTQVASPSTEDASAQPTGMFSSLANRAYRYLWLGSICSSFAMNMQIVARGWLIYAMTQSPLQLAWVTLSFAIPQVCFALFGGVLADRMQKNYIMVIAQSINFIASLIFAGLIFWGHVSFWDFIIFGFINGTILALSMPARQALVPELVGEKFVFNAMALNTASWNLSRILGPAIAGLMIGLLADGDTQSTFGVSVVYLLISVMYLISAITVFFIPYTPVSANDGPRSGVIDEIKSGLVYMWEKPVVFGLIVFSILPFLFGMPIQQLMPAFNQDILNGGPELLGFIMTAMGVGAIIGSLSVARMGEWPHKGRWLMLASVLCGGLIILFSQMTHYFWVFLLAPLIGLFQSVCMSMNRSLLQLQVSQQMRGRIMSIDMMTHGLMPLGIIPVSLVAEYISIDAGLFLSGSLLLMATLVAAYCLPAVRKINRGYVNENL